MRLIFQGSLLPFVCKYIITKMQAVGEEVTNLSEGRPPLMGEVEDRASGSLLAGGPWGPIRQHGLRVGQGPRVPWLTLLTSSQKAVARNGQGEQVHKPGRLQGGGGQSPEEESMAFLVPGAVDGAHLPENHLRSLDKCRVLGRPPIHLNRRLSGHGLRTLPRGLSPSLPGP